MLHFILGGSGSGKSKYIRDVFCSLCAQGEKKLMILVPDQSSFDTEKEFLQALGAKNSRDIKVFGFSRLCDFVLEQSSEPTPTALEEPDRALIMSIALDETESSLKLYGGRKFTDSLITPMLEAIDEYKKCAVTPEQLRRAASQISDASLKHKLTDTALIYETYDALVENKYTEPLKRLEIVKKRMEINNPFKDHIIALDSFTNFTAVELEIISILMRSSRETYAALTLEHSGKDSDGLFFTTNRTYNALKRLAAENGIKVGANTVLTENRRAKAPALAAAEKNLFRTDAEKFDGGESAIHIYRGDTVYEECEYAAAEIKRLIVEEGYFYNDFAILMRNNESYDIILQNALKKYGLRFFDDRRESAADKPLFKLVFYIFDAINNGLDPESVLQILKTDLLPVSVDEIAEFENYIYCWSVTAKQLRSPFVNNPSGFAPAFSAEDTKRLEIIERVRKNTVSPLLRFREKCKDASAEQITAALYELLLELGTDRRIVELSEKYGELGENKFAEEQFRLWDCLMHGLDKIVMIIGNRLTDTKRYARLLTLQLSRADIGFIPQGQDLITVGSVDRIRLNGKKIVFILGAVEGEFPRTPTDSGIFSDNERRRLLNLGLDLDYGCEELIKQEMLLAYSALTAASEKLYVSMYSQNLSGEGRNPSEIITQLCRIFPSLKEETLPAEFNVEQMLYSEQAAFELCAQRFKSRDSLSEQLKEYFSEKEIYSHKLAAMQRAASEKQTDIKSKDISKQLFGDNLRVSATQIEGYYKCSFSYLCNYGFRIKERRKFTLDRLEYGKFMHYILQRFFSENDKSGFADLSEKRALDLVGVYVDDYINGVMGGIDGKSERFSYMLYRIKETAAYVIMHIAEELAQSKFRPEFFEYKIGGDAPLQYELILESGETVSLSGSIDRVDFMDQQDPNGGEKYVRIIDYKTGGKKFNLYDILYGLNLQMLLYLSAICRQGKILPAGILYMPALFSAVNASDKNRKDDIEKAHKKELTMNGLMLDRINVLVGMEERLEGKYIPVAASKREVNPSLITEKQFKQIFAYLDTKVTKMASGIYNGKFSPVPVKGKADGCEWCPYGDVCRFADGGNYTEVLEMKKDEIMNIIENSDGKEEQNGTQLDR